MSAIAKTLFRLSLISYLAVSSIATVHAFPSTSQQPQEAQVSQDLVGSTLKMLATDDAMEMNANCHQKDSGSSQYSLNTCKIFCAVMASVIALDFTLRLVKTNSVTESFALPQGLETREFGLEPQPPKNLPS